MWRLEKDVMEQEAAPEQLEIKNRLNCQEEKMGEMFQQLQSVAATLEEMKASVLALLKKKLCKNGGFCC